MREHQEMVEKFNRTFGIRVSSAPNLSDIFNRNRCIRLMREELRELVAAINNCDLVEIADGLADLSYVTFATALNFGIDLKPIFEEVHRSNMSKVGGILNGQGKLIKPKTYTPPELVPLLKAQGWQVWEEKK